MGPRPRIGRRHRLSFDGGRAPIWTPDGTSVTYSRITGERGIHVKRVDGRGGTDHLVPLKPFHWLIGWTPDRRTLAYAVMDGIRAWVMAFADNQSRTVIEPSATWGGRCLRTDACLSTTPAKRDISKSTSRLFPRAARAG